MRSRKPFLLVSLCLLLVGLVVFFNQNSGANYFAHRVVRKLKIDLARIRGERVELASVSGRVNESGAHVEIIDSVSGWAALTDVKGRFRVRDVLWYPAATYQLIVSDGHSPLRQYSLKAPASFPKDGVIDAGDLEADEGRSVEFSRLRGLNSVSYLAFDSANSTYYKELFASLTAGLDSDRAKITAINGFVHLMRNARVGTRDFPSPRAIMETGSEYCGNLALAMATLLKSGGYLVRIIHMADWGSNPGTHAVVEVYYGSGWHLFDPTYGVIFVNGSGKVASYKDVVLDASMINENSLSAVPNSERQSVITLLRGIYGSGSHHYYAFADSVYSPRSLVVSP